MFCSMACYSAYRLTKQTHKKCHYCGKDIVIRKRSLTRNKYFYCSLECMYKYKKEHDLRETKVNDRYFNKLTPQVCWLLGLLASDGCIRKNKFVILSQSGDHGKICIEHVKNILKYNGKTCIRYPNNNGKLFYKLSINSPLLVNRLKKLNITERKTKTFTIPEEILSDDKKFKYFMIGYIDGDGCIGIYYNNKKIRTKTYLKISLVCNHLMTEQLKKKFENFHFLCCKRTDTLYEIVFNNKDAYLFGKWLYSNFSKTVVYKSYKYEKFKFYLKNVLQLNDWYKRGM